MDNLENRVALIESTFNKIKPNKVEFAEQFYSNLFRNSPELEPLFGNADIKKQAIKLYRALLLLVENIRRPEVLEKVLVPLGEKHKGFGTIEAHYPAVGASLLQTMEEFLESDWTPEAKQAWADTYGSVVGFMLQGAEGKTVEASLTSTGETPADVNKNVKEQEEKQGSKLSNAQLLQRASKSPLLSKFSDIFWETPLWKIALAVSAIFFVLVPFKGQVPVIGYFLGVIEPISIMLALLLYIKETPDRKKQFHYHAWGIIDSATGIKGSHARIIALQDLCDDNVSLKGLDLSGAELSGIELNGCDLSDIMLNDSALDNAEMYQANLSNANMSHSSCASIILTKANLGFANMQDANFSSADFSHADLMFANMTRGNFSGANFSNANLKGASFEGAYLSGANLTGAEINHEDIEKAYLVKTIMPDGIVHE